MSCRFGWAVLILAILVGACGRNSEAGDRLSNTSNSVYEGSIEQPIPADQNRLPLIWRLGEFDSRFGITQEVFERAIARAAAIWEDEARRDLFERSDSLGFPVNLIYDHRQEHILASKSSSDRLTETKRRLAETRQFRNETEARFLRNKDLFEDQKSRFELDLSAHNHRVAEINAKGGATENEAQSLDLERSTLETTRRRIDEIRSQVLRLQDQTNRLSQRCNDLVRQSNTLVAEHNRRFGSVKQTIGECIRSERDIRRINIYAFENQDHLAIVLAHELGHALGLEHVVGEGAIMSEVEAGERGSGSLKLTDRDRNELHRRLAGRN
ncbi:MAG TPA: matrixin family metalloprotease [Fimbriimonadaceae bacterium]|nr:matrixin family metalloprotease [Fimbriimonadaceae bacterium]